jgi:hypothetical protein
MGSLQRLDETHDDIVPIDVEAFFARFPVRTDQAKRYRHTGIQ